jgi:carboxypeptidase D
VFSSSAFCASFENYVKAYYNAGSAAIVLFLIGLGIGVFLWCRSKRRRSRHSTRPDIEEESIPLNPTSTRDEEESFRQRKGKEREEPVESQIFDVGDIDDDEGEYKDEVKEP